MKLNPGFSGEHWAFAQVHYATTQEDEPPRFIRLPKKANIELHCWLCAKDGMKAEGVFTVQGGNYGAVGSHATSKHREGYREAMEATKKMKSPRGTLDGYVTQTTVKFAGRQEAFEYALAEAIVAGLMPLSFIENRRMRRVYRILDPNIKIPSRRTLTYKLIPKLRDRVEAERVLPALTKAEVVHFSFDLWMKQMQVPAELTCRMCLDSWYRVLCLRLKRRESRSG